MDWITGGVRWDAGRLRVHPTGIPYGIRMYNLCTRKDNEAIAVRVFTWRPARAILRRHVERLWRSHRKHSQSDENMRGGGVQQGPRHKHFEN